MARFTLPRDLYHGKGALEALKSFTGKKAMICVGGGSMKRFGFLDRAVEYLKEAGMEVELFEGIEPDPSVETVMRGAEAMLKFEPDWIIAMGGGSPIDAAKAMWIKYEYPEITFEEMCKVFGIPPLRRKAHFCAISSTSGTATEVTAFSIITDYQKGIKYPIADFEITPDVAIVDPDLAETMPKKLVAHTGMDAMTHAVEAYVSTAHCDYTDPLAIFAIRMIQGDLVDSYNGDMSKRDSMHNAQCLAGMAFSNALLGIVHSMAHKTGAAFADYGAHIIHGAANAMYLPKVIAFNAKDPEAKKRYGVIADEMKLGGANDDEKVKLLIEYLRGMNDALNIPHCIQHYGPDSYPTEQGFVPENVFLERLPEIAKNAIADACTGSNPRQPVSIKMAKEQGLSLNPTKISGACGRLMCCLAYEESAYEYLNSIMPMVGSTVRTPDGLGTVLEVNPVSGYLRVRCGTESLSPRYYKVGVCEYVSGGKRAPRRPDPDDDYSGVRNPAPVVASSDDEKRPACPRRRASEKE